MAAEKGMLPPDEADKPWKNGLVTFAAFLVFGSAPLLSFIILIPFTRSDTVKFIGACVLSAVSLSLLGVAKAKIACKSYVFSVASTLLNGATAAAVAYVLGWTLSNVAGLEDWMFLARLKMFKIKILRENGNRFPFLWRVLYKIGKFYIFCQTVFSFFFSWFCYWYEVDVCNLALPQNWLFYFF